MATSHPSSENEQHDFRNPDELSDVTLIVEGQKLYVHRAYLATWSPIFRRMFISDFQEKNASEVTLPEKRVEEVLDLLRCIYPPQKPITEENVVSLLTLSEEYQMELIRERCEQFLLSQDPSLDTLILAQNFRLHKLWEACMTELQTADIDALKKGENYPLLEQRTKEKLYETRCVLLEKKLKNIYTVWYDIQQRCAEHQDNKVSAYCGQCVDGIVCDIHRYKFNEDSLECLECLALARTSILQNCHEALPDFLHDLKQISRKKTSFFPQRRN